MSVFLRDDLAAYWQTTDVFAAAANQQGDVFRAKEGRRTLRFQANNKSWFLKYHAGVGWKEIIKNLTQARLPITSAMNEVRAIEAVSRAGLATMTLAGYGERGRNPAQIESFVVTDDLANTISLEDLTADWQTSFPNRKFKRQLLAEVCRVARVMHDAGINHRDFYLCHFLIDEAAADAQQLAPLHLIDLHRAQVRRQVPNRWRIKDMAGLFFSAMDAGLTQRDLLRAMAIYSDKPWRVTLREDRRFWCRVRQRAEKLYQKDHKRCAPRWL